jgi:hypothetical protein
MRQCSEERWRKHVLTVIQQLKDAMQVDYVVLGGGNAKRFDSLAPGCRRGDNANAFCGGRRLWQIRSNEPRRVNR